MDSPKEQCDEIVAPDLGRWPVPRGFPVVLANRKAYFFASMPITGKGKSEPDPLIEAYDAASAAQEARSNGGKPSEYMEAMGRLATVALARQYSDGIVESILNEEAIDARQFGAIVAAVSGIEPYEVEVKKK